jgi:hypothetical protein
VAETAARSVAIQPQAASRRLIGADSAAPQILAAERLGWARHGGEPLRSHGQLISRNVESSW